MESIETIQEKLYEMLVDVLGVDREQVVPSARFFHDLNGESIDMLELQFQCQRQFGVKVEFQKAVPLDQMKMTEHGHLTPEAVATLRSKLPFIDATAIHTNMTLDHVQELFTVEALTRMIVATLQEAESKPTGTPSLA